MKLHPNKYEFLKPTVEYLGHRINKDGLYLTESKLDAIVMAPSSKYVDELHSFIGLLRYYAKFLPNVSTQLALLYKLEWKYPWRCIQESQTILKRFFIVGAF